MYPNPTDEAAAVSRPALEVRRMADDELHAVVELWHITKRAAYPYLALEQTYTLADNFHFFRIHILPHCAIWVAAHGAALAGFLAINGNYIDRLYVLPDQQRSGIGAALLAKARELSPDSLELATHQENVQARAFYEKQGFRAVRFGISPPPESAPDLTYRWVRSRHGRVDNERSSR
jgi:ribosomal protein S18 acetylase RimI-like enzyme